MNKLVKNFIYLQDKIKHYLFETKIEKKERIFKRKNDRDMEEEELNSYKFYLFTVYSAILVVPLLFLISIKV